MCEFGSYGSWGYPGEAEGSHMVLQLSEYRVDESDGGQDPSLPRDDTVKKGSWGRHTGGSKEEAAKDIAEVTGPTTGGCENPYSIDSLLSSRVTKISVKRVF